MTEGYAALYLSIIKGVSPEIAFKLLDNPRVNKKWTPEDIKCTEEMREKGIGWNEIAESFKTNKQTAQRIFY